jgi:hypothetical protein
MSCPAKNTWRDASVRRSRIRFLPFVFVGCRLTPRKSFSPLPISSEMATCPSLPAESLETLPRSCERRLKVCGPMFEEQTMQQSADAWVASWRELRMARAPFSDSPKEISVPSKAVFGLMRDRLFGQDDDRYSTHVSSKFRANSLKTKERGPREVTQETRPWTGALRDF